ncbi:MAG TPA: hypothetical protein VIG24_01630 [Acidimicrobiia bacterium]
MTYLSGGKRVMDPDDLERWKAYRKANDMHPSANANPYMVKEES